MIYALIGGLWILFSDRLVGFLSGNKPEIILRMSTFKGWFYVGVTALLLYVMIRQFYLGLRESEKIKLLTEEKFSLTLGLMPEAIAIVEKETGRFIEVNDGFCRLLGCVKEDIIGKTGTELNIWGNPNVRDMAARALDDKGDFKDMEIDAKKFNGKSMVVLLSAAIFRLDARDCVIYSAVDITKIKKLENEALLRSAELAESNRELKKTNEDLEFFAHSSYHDLREPLRQISLQIEYLEKKLNLTDPEDIRTFGYIRDGAVMMDSLLNFIRNYTAIRKSKYPVTHVDLTACANAAIGLLSEEIASKHAVITVKPLPGALGSRELYTDVFKNLLSNAVKYAKDAPVISIYAEGNNICVADNGIGIPEKYREKVFELFQRLHTNSEFTGSGVGLSVCKKIVELYGGTIKAMPVKNGGSIMVFTVTPV